MESLLRRWKWPAIFVLLGGAYFLFVGPFSLSELVAAIPAVLGGFGFALLMSRNAERPMNLAAPWGRLARRLPAAVAVDTWKVGLRLSRALVRPMTGMVTRQPFDAGEAGADDAGRRAVVILATSLAPNGFVVRVRQDALLVHQLTPAPVKPDAAWPV